MQSLFADVIYTFVRLCTHKNCNACNSHATFACVQREIDGRTYYEFEFATKANTYIRHALAVVTVANGATLLVACVIDKMPSHVDNPDGLSELLAVQPAGKPLEDYISSAVCRQVLHVDHRFQ